MSNVTGDVQTASIKLRIARVRSPGTVDVHVLQEPWRESTLTANASPSRTPTAVTSFSIKEDEANQFRTVDISGIVRAWLDDPSSNFGLALVPRRGSFHFDSTEGVQGPTLELVTAEESSQTSTPTPTGPADYIVLPLSGDSDTKETEPDRNFGDNTHIVTSRYANRTGFYAFDVSELRGTGVNSATLVIPVSSVSRAGPIQIHRVLERWEERDITAANEPVVDSSPLTSFEVHASDAGGTIKLDLTSLVQDWAAATNTAFGIAFVPGRVNMTTESKEGGSPVSLEIQTDGAVPSPPSGPTVSGVIDRSDEEQPPSPDADAGSESAGTPPTISGIPDTAVSVGAEYRFQPESGDVDSDHLTFTISNKPGWMQFDERVGLLEGTPSSGQIGLFEQISISVSDGVFEDSLPPFDILVSGNALHSLTLSWHPPMQNEDDSPLVDLAGYRIHYGTEPGNYPFMIDIDNPGITAYFLDALNSGAYYFTITAYNLDQMESALSNEVAVLLNQP